MTGGRPVLRLGDRTIHLGEGETVLEALGREGLQTPSSCRAGVCQTCLMQAVEGSVPARAQQGLKDSLKARGYFLSCVCVPGEDMVLLPPGDALDHAAVVTESDDIGAAVRRVRVSVPEGFHWFPGQYLTVLRDDGVARSYSIASLPADGCIELHVRRIPGGVLSNWLHDVARPGDRITLRGPAGECFLTPGEPDAPLLMAGTGTGLAPLYGILRDALGQGHRGPISLFHGALTTDGLYLREELQALCESHPGLLRYHPCVLNPGENDAEPGLLIGPLDEIVLAQTIDLQDTRAYLCGDPGIVDRMRKRLFLKGLSNRRIHADAFLPSKPPK